MIRGERNPYVKYSNEYGIDGVRTAIEPGTDLVRRAVYPKSQMVDKPLNAFTDVVNYKVSGWAALMPENVVIVGTLPQEEASLTQYHFDLHNGDVTIETSGSFVGNAASAVTTGTDEHITLKAGDITGSTLIIRLQEDAKTTGFDVAADSDIGKWKLYGGVAVDGDPDIYIAEFAGSSATWRYNGDTPLVYRSYKFKCTDGNLATDVNVTLMTLFGMFGLVIPPASPVSSGGLSADNYKAATYNNLAGITVDDMGITNDFKMYRAAAGVITADKEYLTDSDLTGSYLASDKVVAATDETTAESLMISIYYNGLKVPSTSCTMVNGEVVDNNTQILGFNLTEVTSKETFEAGDYIEIIIETKDV